MARPADRGGVPAARSGAGDDGAARYPHRDDDRFDRRRAPRPRGGAGRRRARGAAAVADRQCVPRLRSRAVQGGSARAGDPAVDVLGGLGDGARAGDVALLPLPADAPDGAPRARRRGARCGQSLGAQRAHGDGRARASRPVVRRDGAGHRERHQRAQTHVRRVARLGGQLSVDLRRRRGLDLRPRPAHGRDPRRQSQGLRDVRLHARRVPVDGRRQARERASRPTRRKVRWS